MAMRQPSDPLEEALASALPPEQRVHIPALLALLARPDGQLSAADARSAISADSELAPLLPALEAHQVTASLISIGAESQLGDISAQNIAGRDVINLTVNVAGGAPAEAEKAAARFADGLSALHELVRTSPEAHAVVQIYQGKLKAARGQVRELINLKILHDLLHGVQYQDLPLLISEALRFPDDETALMGIDRSEINLRAVVDQVEQLVTSGEVPSAEASWRGDLRDFTDQIRHAIDALDRAMLNPAILRLNRLLATQLSFINARLYEKASALRADQLATPLQRIYERLSAVGPDAAQLQRVQAGIDGLLELHANLGAMITNHNDWQEIDRELRSLDASLRQGIDDLVMFWPDVSKKVTRLCNGAESWAVEIRQHDERLQQLLSDPRPPALRLTFARLQHRVTTRFFQIDTSLRKLCDRLRDFRDPLNELEFDTL